MTITITITRNPALASPATPPSPADQCEYSGHAWDSMTVSQLQRAMLSSRAEYYAALAAWQARCAALVAAGLDYHADDAPAP